MSETELYEIARSRVNSHNRGRTLWAFNLGGLLFSLAALVALGMSGYAVLGSVIFFAWCGVFVVHTVLLRMAESRASDIEIEVAKLRDALYDKPKRLEISDDGEMVEFADEPRQKFKYSQGER